MMVLIAGPYRSGTGDDPVKMAANLKQLETVALPLWERGHIPMIGEWVALPVWRGAGGSRIGDEAYERIMHPTAERLLDQCGAILQAARCVKGRRRRRGLCAGARHPGLLLDRRRAVRIVVLSG